MTSGRQKVVNTLSVIRMENGSNEIFSWNCWKDNVLGTQEMYNKRNNHSLGLCWAKQTEIKKE